MLVSHYPPKGHLRFFIWKDDCLLLPSTQSINRYDISSLVIVSDTVLEDFMNSENPILIYN